MEPPGPMPRPSTFGPHLSTFPFHRFLLCMADAARRFRRTTDPVGLYCKQTGICHAKDKTLRSYTTLKPTSSAPAKSWPSFKTSAWGLICFLILLEGVRIQEHFSPFTAGILLLLSIAVPIIVAEALVFKSYKHAETGLDFRHASQVDLKRVAIKLFGLYASMAMIGVCYFAYREYAGGFYHNYFLLLKYLIPTTCILAIPYIYILDRYLLEKEDANWHAGMFFLGRIRQVDRKIFKNHILGWFVKGFFLPLMFTYFIQNIGTLQHQGIVKAAWELFTKSPYPFYHAMVTTIFTIDLAYVSIGYMATFRIFNSHIRTVEPTFLGWFVALICYHPFWKQIDSIYLSYNKDNLNFDGWLANHPALMIVWGSTIILLLMVYVWATIQFGIRFSNLTHRGIITNGPYRFCKHPAYVSKNLSWWLIAVPFISNDGIGEAVKNCLLLANVNLIYYLRAKTEEAHLGKDVAYQKYMAYMKEHSLYARFMKLLRVRVAMA
jgi:isoprenylcysteine carboxyl methyltransferase (ICMT) family protein YpbQ